ncbi:hypothetical protein K0M31_009936, partial [Melipona bicolor]
PDAAIGEATPRPGATLTWPSGSHNLISRVASTIPRDSMTRDRRSRTEIAREGTSSGTRPDDLGNVKQGGSADADTSQLASVSSGWTVNSGRVSSISRGHETRSSARSIRTA